MKIYDFINIHTDGGARGNPGPAAIGVVITSGEEQIAQFGKQIGEATNNTAEYTAVIEAFTFLKHGGLQAKKITVFMDSQVVARQLSGVYKIKKPHLQNLFAHVKTLEKAVGEQVEYISVPRAQNSKADSLLNGALDTNA